MATPIIIFPSLSRAPSLDSGQKTFDDTIRDQMDLGYVATRPRFSRRRRTWTQNVRALQLEDVRALDVFANETVQAGAQSFYYPNLVPNWSFEFPAESADEAFAGWELGNCAYCTVGAGSTAADGITSAQVQTAADSLPAGASLTANLLSTKPFQVIPGEIYTGVFQFSAVLTGLVGTINAMSMFLVLEMSDGSEVVVNPTGGVINEFTAEAFTEYSQAFTIPAPGGGLTIVGAVAQLSVTITNNSGAALALSATNSGNYAALCFDAVGLALIAPAPGYSIYGRMVGSSSLPFPVRFAASKNPAFSDLGFGDGVKRYGATFDLEEV